MKITDVTTRLLRLPAPSVSGDTEDALRAGAGAPGAGGQDLT